ncbi:CHAT domain-containing protein [Streptomyces sp. NPDC085946]|uniref:CHAT domain-containing protein n=1 Tax=Streptomyces sp. NPDC085946 TaxID=3365744 RepID=UPI0037D4C0A3
MTTEGEAGRDRLLAAARRRLRRVKGGDPAAVHEPGADAEIQELRRLLAGGPDLEAGYRLAWLLLLRHLERQPDDTVMTAIAGGFAACLLAGVDDIPAPLLPHVASVAEPAAVALLKQAVTAPGPAPLDTVVDQYRRILAATPADHPGRPQRLANLGIALHARHERRAAEADLTAAIELLREAVDTTRPGDPDLALRLSGLAGALRSRERPAEAGSAPPASPGSRPERPGAPVDTRRRPADAAAAPANGPADPVPGTRRDRTDAVPGTRTDRTGTGSDRTGTVSATRGDPADAVHAIRAAVAAAPAGSAHRALCLSNLGLALRERYERDGNPADLDEAIEAGRQAWETTAPGDPNRTARLRNLAGTLLLRYRHVAGAGVLEAAAARLHAGSDVPADAYTVCFLAGLDDIPRAVAPDVAAAASALAFEPQTRLTVSYDRAEHERIIRLWRRILRITPPGDPHRHVFLADLSQALLLRHQLTGSAPDLEAALTTARRSVKAAPAGDPRRGLGLVNLASALAARYRAEGDPDDLDLAVDLQREAAERHGATDRARYLCDLGGLLALRFDRYQDPADLDAAVAALRASTGAVPADPLGPGPALSGLGEALEMRYVLTGEPADLDEAVDTLRTAVEATPPEHWLHAQVTTALGKVLASRFEQRGHRPDLDEGIGLLRTAAGLAPEGSPQRTVSRGNLAYALFVRLQAPGLRAADLDETVALARENLACLPAGHHEEARFRALLTDALRVRFEQRGDPRDLAEAAALGRESLSAGPGGLPTGPVGQLNAGAAALMTHNLVHPSPGDLDAAIDALRAVVRALPPGTVWRPVALNNLALALLARASHSLDGTDLEAAIEAQRTAVREAGPGHHARPVLLSALGGFLQARAAYRGTVTDLDEAIDVLAAAAEAGGPGHPQRHLIHPNWCQALLLRAEATGSAADLEAAVAVAREGVAATPAGNPRRPWALGRLGGALLRAHLHRVREDVPGARPGPAGDLDEAIAVLREACGHGGPARTDATGRTDRSHPGYGAELAPVVMDLVTALRARHRRDGDPADRAEAFTLAAHLASSGAAPPAIRAGAAVEAGRLVADPSRTADFYETAVTLLPRIAPRRLRRGDQQHLLAQFGGLASYAAARALEDPGRPPARRAARALRLLEEGRGVLMGQALQAWSDLTALRREHPGLASRFEWLRDMLDRPDDGTDALLGELVPPGFDGGPGLGAVPAPGFPPGGVPAVVDRHRLAGELADVLARIREHEGFGSFARPPSLEELLEVAEEGAVVVLNVVDTRGDALLVTRSGVTAVELPGLDMPTATRLATGCQAAAHNASDGTREARIEAQETLSTILARLWDVVAEPVLTALGHHRAPADGVYPRVWWVPGGPLAWLPVHAAGHHDGSDRSVLDRVVSSYTPTLRALRHARRPLPAGAAPGRPLVVAMPETPGERPLDFAADEAEVCAEHLAGAVVLQAPERPPTRAGVLRLLPGCPVAHFACHGDSTAEDPSRHRLLLHDHAEAPLTVADLASVRLDHARLAYLSACETAVSYDGLLFDEAIQLASAFQLCGFRHVVGTLWPVVDDTAVEFAEAFYTALRPAPGAAPDTGRAPYALHSAVRELRARLPRAPSLWASHVHTGA